MLNLSTTSFNRGAGNGSDDRADYLYAPGWSQPSDISEFNIWIRGNGTGKVRIKSSEDRTGDVVDFGSVEVTLVVNEAGTLYFANLAPEQVTSIEDGSVRARAPPPPVLPTLSIADASAVETGGSMSFTVTLSTTSTSTVSAHYTTSDGTATAGSDYTATTGTFAIAAGTLSGDFTIPITNDTDVEERETFTVTLSSPTNAELGTATATGTIISEDVAPPTLITFPPVITISLDGIAWLPGTGDQRADYLYPVDYTHPTNISEFNVWIRGNGTGKVRIVSTFDYTGATVDFGGFSVELAQQGSLYYANITAAQVCNSTRHRSYRRW